MRSSSYKGKANADHCVAQFICLIDVRVENFFRFQNAVRDLFPPSSPSALTAVQDEADALHRVFCLSLCNFALFEPVCKEIQNVRDAVETVQLTMQFFPIFFGTGNRTGNFLDQRLFSIGFEAVGDGRRVRLAEIRLQDALASIRSSRSPSFEVKNGRFNAVVRGKQEIIRKYGMLFAFRLPRKERPDKGAYEQNDDTDSDFSLFHGIVYAKPVSI